MRCIGPKETRMRVLRRPSYRPGQSTTSHSWAGGAGQRAAVRSAEPAAHGGQITRSFTASETALKRLATGRLSLPSPCCAETVDLG
jgi:hypothetical protein